MEELQIFNNEEFGSVRTAEINGEIFFVGKDIAQALGYADTRKAVAMHVDDDDKTNCPIMDSVGREQETTVINESGLYSLVLSSKLESAKRFKHWVTSEVLPSIRKSGAYSMVDRSQLSPNLQALSMIIDSMTKQELDLKHQQEQIAKLEQSQEVIKEAVTPVIDNWREDIVRKIRKIQSSNGADFKSLNTEMYKELERRAGCDLNTRLRNKQQRMYEMGCTKTSINGVRKIDIIDEDKKLREIYGKIVTEYVIRYCA